MTRPVSNIQSDVVIRAIGIMLIVASHAETTIHDVDPSFRAGLNMLVLVAGFSFARFLPHDPTITHVWRSVFKYARAIIIPTTIALALSFVYFVASTDRIPNVLSSLGAIYEVALFPLWYPVELLVLLLFTAASLSILIFFGIAKGSAWRTFLLLTIVAVGFRVVRPELSFVNVIGQGNQIVFWNFFVGMLLQAAVSARQQRTIKITAALAAISALSVVTWGDYPPRLLTTILSGALIALLPSFRMPRAFAQATIMVSQAALATFLFHLPAIEILHFLAPQLSPWIIFPLAMTLCVLGWAFAAAFFRTVQRVSNRDGASLTGPRSPVQSRT